MRVSAVRLVFACAACASPSHPASAPTAPCPAPAPIPAPAPAITPGALPVLDEAAVKDKSHAFFDAFDRADVDAFEHAIDPAFVFFATARFYDSAHLVKSMQGRIDRHAPARS